MPPANNSSPSLNDTTDNSTSEHVAGNDNSGTDTDHDNSSQPVTDNETPAEVNNNNAGDTQSNTDSEAETNGEIIPQSATPDAPAVDVKSQSVIDTIAQAISKVLGNALGTNSEVYELPAEAVGSNRTINEVSDEHLAAIPSGQKPAVVLAPITVQKSGIYVFGVTLSNLKVGAKIFLNLLSSSVSSSEFFAAAQNQNAYTFLDDYGNEVTTVPANKHVNVAAYLEAGITYEPIISVEDPDAQNVVSEPETQEASGSSGGGCNSLQAGFAALTAILFIKRKHS